MRWFLMALFIIFVLSQSQQKFVYSANQTMIVESNSSLQIFVSLLTAADEYLSQATIMTTLTIYQNTSISYNILYFNYQQALGQQCYQNWIIYNQSIPKLPCNMLENQDMLPQCMNFTACLQERLQFTIHLTEEIYKQNYIIVQNTNMNESIVITTKIQMNLSSKNTWFYWGVGLTCLLLISLVIFAGIIFYWMLKYKKVKKMFEQYKLTQEQGSFKKD